jgi:hypothetical protein
VNLVYFRELSYATAMGKTRKSEIFYDAKDKKHLDLIFIRFLSFSHPLLDVAMRHQKRMSNS